MPELVCTTFDAFEAGLAGFDGRYYLMGRDQGEWRAHTFYLERVLVQIMTEGAAHSFEGAVLQGWATLFLPRSPPQWFRMLGRPMQDRTMIHYAPGEELRAAVSSANEWLSISTPVELLLAHADNNASLVRASRYLDLDTPAIAALRVMLDQLAALEIAGRLPTQPLSSVLERQLLAMWGGLLSRGSNRSPRNGRPAVSREVIFDKAVSFMDRQAGTEIRLDDLCSATGVSERTLRAIFNDEVGIGPHQYLQIRRLHTIRQALIAATPTSSTVAGIALRHGYWNGSRLAHDYHALFGELPSATLHHRFSSPSQAMA